jgi:lactate dehydrogenase-like 2-hydroxyacid dehydrogenase
VEIGSVDRDLSSFDALVTPLSDRIDAALLDRAPNVRIVANVAVGLDNVDLEACKARNVRVTNTPGVLTEATADLAFGLLIAAARRIAEGDRSIRAGEFPPWRPTAFLGAPVSGATLGILGMGRIGGAMARRARGFGMHVLYNQRRQLPAEVERALLATFVPLDELFRASDFLSLHCPLTTETRHIVSKERMQSMKPGSILVNTARGGCVDEAALADVLDAGPIGAAGLDVFEDEPRVHENLLKRNNVVLTPHIASADRRTREAMARMAADNVIAFAQGKEVLSPAPGT